MNGQEPQNLALGIRGSRTPPFDHWRAVLDRPKLEVLCSVFGPTWAVIVGYSLWLEAKTKDHLEHPESTARSSLLQQLLQTWVIEIKGSSP